MLDLAFDQIREHLSGKVAVAIALAAALGRVAEAVDSERRRAAVRRHLDKLERSTANSIREPEDIERVRRALNDARSGLAPERCAGAALAKSSASTPNATIPPIAPNAGPQAPRPQRESGPSGSDQV